MPDVVLAGHDVKITCDYDLDRQRLYQVKWYKGSHEFYRYSPSDRNRIKLFLVENLKVDVSLPSRATAFLFLLNVSTFQVQQSDENSVFLEDLHVDMTGKYTCEVSTEVTFETVRASGHMAVVGEDELQSS